MSSINPQNVIKALVGNVNIVWVENSDIKSAESFLLSQIWDLTEVQLGFLLQQVKEVTTPTPFGEFWSVVKMEGVLC